MKFGIAIASRPLGDANVFNAIDIRLANILQIRHKDVTHSGGSLRTAAFRQMAQFPSSDEAPVTASLIDRFSKISSSEAVTPGEASTSRAPRSDGVGGSP